MKIRALSSITQNQKFGCDLEAAKSITWYMYNENKSKYSSQDRL